MTALWTFDAMVDATGGRLVPAGDGVVTGLSIDTRTLQPGDAFFAITGERLDGHDYVTAALASGASIAVVAAERLSSFADAGTKLVVPDVLAALRDLAAAARRRSAAKIVAITGSVGKTGTKEAMRRALSACGSTHASAASFNNHWGVPLSLARMPTDTDFGVFEIGMSAPGEIAPLVRLVRPHVAIVTTIAAAHAAFFSSEEAIADAKAEIFLGLEPGGTAVLNRDNRHFDRLAAAARAVGARIVGFGTDAAADVRLVDVRLEADRSEVEIELFGRRLAYELGAPGRHLVMNSLAIAAAVDAVGADLEVALGALGGFSAPVGRGKRHVLQLAGGTAMLIDESYNANPTSMRAAFEVLALAPVGPGGRRIAVLGDMRELGADGPALHAALAADIEAAGIDRVHCAGPLMASLYDALPASLRGARAETAAELEPAIEADLAPGDVLMIKASNGSRLGPVVAHLCTRFAGGTAVGSGV
ncbi:UDP-N-acetylmuramoyl-tripeptide--D-alanyl-D-alanine ligase [Pseudoxanthobacter soli DSM 19599]|uniref:UDP-N-acetylmuramoyl-tripeptide--D-alanyl-D-alanine ligase n=1 Tax=Pseudoxanthobacter soli DSM 19599 TaxID=1123029 RepID=A0A1M7ZDS4_9HYPH|nr:UDP-N-acetylmuramoylalanyl-D-glutamyl-2,6-diaminopimelate--D-alanyl-D-alanine ligase [Pseudoxanthobacter soli]SHO63040.1 UDP-N-acetylmuramoyl-tripeptide--D-alanyl-D-alanine ligase [Pseudoxanthobacter soli DSM 19599]